MIDAHAHLVSDDPVRFPPAPPGGNLPPGAFDRPLTVERLLEDMAGNGVDKAVLVQRGSIYGFDSDYVCESAGRFPDKLAAVCSIDATDRECGAQVHHWVKERGAAGIRLMELVRGQGVAWLDSPLARDVWAAAAEVDVPVCVHLFASNRIAGLERLVAILGDIPNLRIVIDHLGAIRSDAGPPDHGVDDMLEAVARFDGVHLKFTTIPLGRLDEAGVDSRPVIKRVMNLFGVQRMMWGSDITQSPGSYAHMVALGRAAVAGLPSAEQEQLLSGTARAVYGKTWA